MTVADDDVEQIKVVVVGDGAVGKTAMLVRYIENKFTEGYIPTVFENYYHDVQVDGIMVNLGLWDTAGQEDFDRLRSLSYNDTDLLVVVFSVAAPSSLSNASRKWIPEVQLHCKDTPFILVGTKADLRENKSEGAQRSLVTSQEAIQAAKGMGAQEYIECSALTGEGVKDVFEKAVRIVLRSHGRFKSSKRLCCTVM